MRSTVGIPLLPAQAVAEGQGGGGCQEYHKHRRAAKWFKPSDETGMRAFEAANPEKCPSCGAQVFDPFGRRVVIHNVERCKSSNA